MAVRSALLRQLLELDASDRVEIAQALLSSVDEPDNMSETERAWLHAAIEYSITEIEAGETIPCDEVLASLRAKRPVRTSW